MMASHFISNSGLIFLKVSLAAHRLSSQRIRRFIRRQLVQAVPISVDN
jgi:hypothetical protein